MLGNVFDSRPMLTGRGWFLQQIRSFQSWLIQFWLYSNTLICARRKYWHAIHCTCILLVGVDFYCSAKFFLLHSILINYFFPNPVLLVWARCLQFILLTTFYRPLSACVRDEWVYYWMDYPNRFSPAATGRCTEWVFGLTVYSHPCKNQLLAFVSETKAWRYKAHKTKFNERKLKKRKKETPQAAIGSKRWMMTILWKYWWNIWCWSQRDSQVSKPLAAKYVSE